MVYLTLPFLSSSKSIAKALNKTVNDYINKTMFASRNQTYLSQIVTKTNLFIALLAWFVGLFSAILSQKFFKNR